MSVSEFVSRRVESEDVPAYETGASGVSQGELQAALRVIEGHIKALPEWGPEFRSAVEVEAFLTGHLAAEADEWFCVLYMDNKHRLIEFRREFRGTVDGCKVQPRGLMRSCIELNAAAMIFVHNHPSGEAEPSMADIDLTEQLVRDFKKFEIRVLDHMIVGRDAVVSLAARGLV